MSNSWVFILGILVLLFGVALVLEFSATTPVDCNQVFSLRALFFCL